MEPAARTLPSPKALEQARGWGWWWRRAASALWAGAGERMAERARLRLLAPIEELVEARARCWRCRVRRRGLAGRHGVRHQLAAQFGAAVFTLREQLQCPRFEGEPAKP